MIDDYQRVRLLGRGTTAHVWLAEGPSGPVALKVAHQAGHLRREIAALRKINHPSIAKLVDSDDGGDWLVLEHAERGACDEWGVGQPLSVLVEFCAKLADGIAHLHAAGVVHDDIKPANVLVGADGGPRLVDLGSARDGAGQAATGGTPGYTAPERLRAAPATVATDLWGLGAVIYTLLASRPPFPGEDPATVQWAPLATLPEPPSSSRPGLPAALDELVLRLLAHRPDARPPSARGVAASLRASIGGPVRAPMVGMTRERDQLRRALVDVLGGGRSMVVLYGREGSGRRALIREGLRAARREGVRVVQAGDAASVVAELASGECCAMAVDASAVSSEPFLLDLLLGSACALILVRSDRPLRALARRGARQIRPPLLTCEEVTALVQGLGHGRRKADAVWRRSAGLPAAVHGILQPTPIATLPAPMRGVMEHLGGGAVTVSALAKRMNVGEHALLDIVEPMIDRGLVAASSDGAWLSVPR